jgi:Xaa-Pro aminopeptidase
MHFAARLDALRKNLSLDNLEWYFTTTLHHIRYLSGFTGSNAFLLIGPSQVYFISDFRYQEQSRQEVPDAEITIYHDQWFESLVANNWYGALRVGFDPNFLTVSTLEKIKNQFSKLEWIPLPGAVEKLMRCKSKDEIELIQQAVKLTDAVFLEIIELIRPGTRERDISAEISYRFKKKGAEKDAFDPIVASGPRAALPHARPSDVKFKSGDCVVLDFGCTYQGYASDMTRTVFLGNPNPELKKIYQITLEAQVQAIGQARPKMACSALDAVARDHIQEKGYGNYFGHSLGHGVGLMVHEDPRISKQNEELLEVNNVITIEPGIYLPNVGGVRIEDIVVITDSGARLLTRSSKEMMVL